MAVPHKQVSWQTKANKPPMVQFDFMYMTSEADLLEGDEAPAKAWSTVLVGVDENTGYPMSIVVDSKGANNQYLHDQAVVFIDQVLRHRKMIVRTDGEPAIKSLANYIQLKRTWDTRVETSPRYSSGSAGLVEAMIKRVQGQCRTLKLDFEERYKIRVQVESIIWAWMVVHSTWLIARYNLRGPNARSAFAQLNDYNYDGEVVRYGEVVLWRQSFPHDRAGPRKTRMHKGDPAWHRGVWVGRRDDNDEHVTVDMSGVHFSRSVRRCAPADQIDLRLVENLRGTP